MENQRYKLLVMDIDGTLLNREGKISDADREALAQVCRLGLRVCLSTGRTLQSGLKIINLLPLDGYHIFFDGALVANPIQNEEIFVLPIPREIVREAVQFAHQHDIRLELYSSTHYFVEQETWATNVRRQYFGINPTVVDFDGIWERERIIKGTVAVFTAEERAKADKLCQRFKNELGSLHFSWTATPAYPNVDFINIVAPGVSKGKALEALASHLSIPLSEVLAIGDERNDVSLFELAGFSVAMGNAPDEVKAAADYITLDVEQSGVAAAIKKFLL